VGIKRTKKSCLWGENREKRLNFSREKPHRGTGERTMKHVSQWGKSEWLKGKKGKVKWRKGGLKGIQ